MRSILLLVIVLFFLSSAEAQNIRWNTAPKTGFVFQITNAEAQKLLTKSRPDTIVNALLHTRIDTFNVDKGWTRRPDKGHFILARVVENKLHCEYTSVFPYQVLLLKEYNALALQVLDLEGNIRKDARVKFKLRRIAFDGETKTYRIENEWFRASSKYVTVELDGFRSVFNIEKHEVPSWSQDYYSHDDGPDFYSYMITDKNRYKPGEKIRFKSYALSGSRSPIRKELEVRLMKSGNTVKVGSVTPHRPGSFSGEIQLHDSLKLTLDQFYSLQLWDRHGRVVSNCSFKYEDYELHGNKLDVILEDTRQFHPASNFVTITATSENNLLLKDARATVTILAENVREIFAPVIILPDTLLVKQIQLDPDAPTTVEIPSSIFRESNTSYYVHVAVLNSQNQRLEKAIPASHFFSQYELTARYVKDSIVYEALNNGAVMSKIPAKLYHNNVTRPIEITLPYRERINPVTSTVKIESEYVSRSIDISHMLPKLEIEGGIQKDSFNIAVVNPQAIEFSWFVYQGSELLEKGAGPEMVFRNKIENRETSYYAELLFTFAGAEHIVSREFKFRKGELDISLNLPERVYPGQKVDALIEVTDDAGNAVSGVDLTALATTSKLNYYLPALPHYGQISNSRSAAATYTKRDVNRYSAILDLDYNVWAPRLRLDTMKYYQFAYPGKRHFVHQVDIDDKTQFSMYVMRRGQAQQIYVIEVDRTPVFFSWTTHPQGYSFYVDPDKKRQITLRLFDRVLVLDSMSFDACKKTIISIDLDHLPDGIKTLDFHSVKVKMPNGRKVSRWKFTEFEMSRYRAWLAAFKTNRYRSYLTARERFVAITTEEKSGQRIIAGPVEQEYQTYHEPELNTRYRHEGGFLYSFEDNIVYKENLMKMFPEYLADVGIRATATINDVALNEKIFLEHRPYQAPTWHPQVIDLVDHSCRTKVMLPAEVLRSGVASVLFEDSTSHTVVPACRSSNGKDFFTVPRERKNLIVLYNNGTYLTTNNIEFRSHAHIVVDMRGKSLHPADSNSHVWLRQAPSNCFGSPTPVAPRSFVFTQPLRFIGNIQGTIFDDTAMPLPGANILVKGTMTGSVSDVDGRFTLDVPNDPSTLVISFIGYMTQEIEVRPGSHVSVVLEPDVQALQEVVVVGYGTTSKQSLTGAVTSLSGKTAGVTISRTDDDGDGLAKITDDESAAEQKMYQELLTLKNIRSNFSDVAFWEPTLFTDRRGEAKFTVTFPDDITRWDAVVFGMNRRLQTGTVRKSIKSYKPLMAELSVPQFLTMGDSANFVGKVLNYTSDKTIRGTIRWNQQGSGEHDLPTTFESYHADRLPITVLTKDSVSMEYSFTRDDGYFDGEKRKVPVVEQGTVRAKGTLELLDNGQKVDVKADKGSVVHVELADNPLDVFAGDVRYLVNYKYDCNEQLASKLFGLLGNKLIMTYEGKEFRYDKDVNKIIQRLLRNQNAEFLWSWWNKSEDTSPWMSAHILRALKAAKDAGYVVNLDLDNVVRKATYKYEFMSNLTVNDVSIIHALAEWGANINYARYVNKLEQDILDADSIARIAIRTQRGGYRFYSSMNEKLLLLEVRQLRHLPFVRDSLLQYKRETALNEIYFSDDRPTYHWYRAGVCNNAIAYRIVRRDSVLRDMTTRMLMYFLSSRKNSRWNTYEASGVVTTILPDLISAGSSKKAVASVRLTGQVNAAVRKFPYRTSLTDGQQLHITKDTGAPLYCMQYVEERVTTAQSGSDAFTIKTQFSQTLLKAGTPAILKATVEVKRDAKLEHVMIEIPIPGGCSYADKDQVRNRIETHREYFKDRTVIFCENMHPGTYGVQVELLPRFTGKYHVNPAQVSLMYFPVVNANNDMRTVNISE